MGAFDAGVVGAGQNGLAVDLSMFVGSPFLAAHRDELASYGLAFARAAACFASIFRNETFLGASEGVEKIAATIAAASAKDAATWRGAAAPYMLAKIRARQSGR
jgi:phytoene dehydrogenase-like protein